MRDQRQPLILVAASQATSPRQAARARRQYVRTVGALAPALPEMVFIEVASVCNLACSMCKLSSPAYNGTKPKFLSLAQCEQILGGLPSEIRCINLQGLGEPLLHPH